MNRLDMGAKACWLDGSSLEVCCCFWWCRWCWWWWWGWRWVSRGVARRQQQQPPVDPRGLSELEAKGVIFMASFVGIPSVSPFHLLLSNFQFCHWYHPKWTALNIWTVWKSIPIRLHAKDQSRMFLIDSLYPTLSWLPNQMISLTLIFGFLCRSSIFQYPNDREI